MPPRNPRRAMLGIIGVIEEASVGGAATVQRSICYNAPTETAMIRDEVVSKLKADEPHLRARGVTRLALFGSVVRGEERPDSDVDVLIDVDPNVKFSLLDHAGVMNRLEDLLGRPVEVCRRETLKPLLRDRIIAEAMDIF